MKTLRLCLCAVSFLLLSPSAIPQHQPHPPGLQDPSKNAPPLEPPMNPRPQPKIAQVQREANELAVLSQSVSSDINLATKGVLPKDLGAKLKRIEKLSKKLRSELAL